MDVGLLARGLVVGFAVAAALGPIGLLVIRRTIENGYRHGWVSGLGVASADALYAAVAAFGLTAVRELLLGADRWLGLAGGTVLVAISARSLWRLRRATDPGPSRPARPPVQAPWTRDRGAIGAWASMLGLTLTNPATILSFAALFAGLGAGTGGPPGAAMVTLGVLIGSAAWWTLLVGIVAGLRARIGSRTARRLNLTSALLIGGFGVAAILLGLGAAPGPGP